MTDEINTTGPNGVKPCRVCGATDRRPSGRCRPCGIAASRRWASSNQWKIQGYRVVSAPTVREAKAIKDAYRKWREDAPKRAEMRNRAAKRTTNT